MNINKISLILSVAAIAVVLSFVGFNLDKDQQQKKAVTEFFDYN